MESALGRRSLGRSAQAVSLEKAGGRGGQGEVGEGRKAAGQWEWNPEDQSLAHTCLWLYWREGAGRILESQDLATGIPDTESVVITSGAEGRKGLDISVALS